MRLGVLFSGGKDSTYAAYLASKEHEVTCLISLFSSNPESYMFHTPNIHLVEKQAKAMDIPILISRTKGEKEKELEDLEKAIKQAIEKYKIQGIVTGALHSNYQFSRIQKICDNLKIKCINPLWHKDEIVYWDELLKNKFEIMIVGVAAEGLGEEWLGRIITPTDLEELKKLKERYKFHLAFEGGEAETFVKNCPLFKKRIEIIKGKRIWEGSSGIYIIEEVKLIDK